MTTNPYAAPNANVTDQAARADELPSASVSFEQLPTSAKWLFLWGFVWRSLIATVTSMIGGGIAGAVLGAATGLIGRVLGASRGEVVLLSQIFGGLGGLAISVGVLWLFLRWLFRAKWFGYRLRLVREAP